MFRQMRKCPRCEATTIFTDPDEWAKWDGVNGCPACAKAAEVQGEASGDPLPGGIQVSVNGVPVQVLRWETVLTQSVGPGGVPVAFDSGRRIIEVVLPGDGT